MNRMTAGLLALVLIVAAAGGAYWFAVGASGAVDGADPGDAGLVARGKALYAAHCASCHGKVLEGQADWRRLLPDGGLPAPPHDETGHTWHHPDRLLFDYTKKGGAALAPPGFKSNMPGFAGTLSDAEIWAVLSFIKSEWPSEVRRRQADIDRRANR